MGQARLSGLASLTTAPLHQAEGASYCPESRDDFTAYGAGFLVVSLRHGF
jgi:hypothetical protein